MVRHARLLLFPSGHAAALAHGGTVDQPRASPHRPQRNRRFEMRLSPIMLGLGFFLAIGCATGPTTKTPQTPPDVAAAGLVRIASTEPGDLFAHPGRSIDDYDDILLSDVDISYGPEQKPLSEDDVLRVQSMAYSVVMHQVPAAGQLIATEP